MPATVVPTDTSHLTKQLIDASWRRCRTEYGMAREFHHGVPMKDSGEVQEIRDSLDDVFATSAGIFHRMRQIGRDVGYVVLFANHDGVIIESFADTLLGEEIAREGLRKGAVWDESIVGTNGVGTAITSRQPLTVHGGSHYNADFRGYTCSAAPIFTSDGRVIGALDMSSRAVSNSTDEYRFAEYFVREAAQHMSMLLFRRAHQSDCLVALSTGEPDPMPMSSKALVAASEDGTILGATPEAYAILGVPEISDLSNKSIKDLWDVTLNDLKPLSAHNVPLQLQDGETAYATAFLPKLKKSKSSKRVVTPGRFPGTDVANAPKQKPLDRFAGSDPSANDIVTLCRRINNKDVPVLLLGDTGVGKDTLARAMHDESERSLRPYVAVNCAAIPETLLASELFGYVAGSFTGASRSGRIGKIQSSDSGTLFLDEIGDMPIQLQAHLLRVLEERTVTPLGSSEGIPVDIKIICATHQDLPKLVEEGKFRRDLYFRIKGAQIVIPSLRNREDIAELAAAIIKEEADEAGQAPAALSDEVIDVFKRYAWPGNIRELRSVIRLILSLYPEERVTIDHLPYDLVSQANSGAGTDGLSFGSSFGGMSLDKMPSTLGEANEVAEEHLIVEALRAQKWNVTNAAKRLGISRATLHRKIRKYNIVAPNNQA